MPQHSQLAIVHSRAQTGIEAPAIQVEVHVSGGLPSLSIVGLPETAVKESKDRVRAALLNSYFEHPAARITINLAPADLPKEGGRFDLPIALGILAATGQVPTDSLKRVEVVGELALGGDIRPVRAIIPAAIAAKKAGRDLIVPEDNAAEAARVSGVRIFAARHLLDVTAHLRGEALLPQALPDPSGHQEPAIADLADVRGQHQAKRALELAASGGHSLLMSGPPGTGKTMLASRLPGILPTMNEEEALEVAAIASVCGDAESQWSVRPMRNPHHTASGVALVGGSSHPKPGEISRAHNGVLFLDELPEFDRKVLEVLREPMETGHITISRAARQAIFPARFQLVAAMNPCPCGYLGDKHRACSCSPDQIARYRSRISGPLLDRIDLQVDVQRVPQEMLRAGQTEHHNETSATIRARVEQTQQRQMVRAGKLNAALTNREIDQFCALSDRGHQLLDQAMERFGLSARSYHRILKVARTIADMAGCEHIELNHLSEAIGYRQLDKQSVGS